MFRKILEAFFRHKLLLLLPPVLIPAVVTPIAVLSTPPLYETAVGVWIDHPAYLNVKDGSSTWVTAVQAQSARLNDLLRTRAFMIDVAQRTSLAPLVGSPSGEQRIADIMSRAVTIGGGSATGATGAAATAPSEHLLVIRVQLGTGQLSYELCKAIVDAYQEKSAADLADQASIAVDFYQGRVQDAKQQLTKVSQDLRRYAAARQGSVDANQTTDSAASLPAVMLDPKLGTLQSTVQAAQLDVNTAQSALNQAQQDAMAAAQGLQYGFQILDPPQLAVTPTPQTKKIIVYPIAAFVVGLGLTGMLLVLLVASDRSARSELDITSGLRVLGTLPTLQLKRVPKQLGASATRRAIGSIAGTALPAPGGVR